MEKLCLTCSEKLTGRADKKYCNDACKNEFHNQHISQKTAYEKKQLSTARKNRNILSQLEASGQAEIGVKELECFGFDFEGLTGLKILGKGTFLLCCFDYRIRMTSTVCNINKIKI